MTFPTGDARGFAAHRYKLPVMSARHLPQRMKIPGLVSRRFRLGDATIRLHQCDAAALSRARAG